MEIKQTASNLMTAESSYPITSEWPRQQ